MAGGGTGSLRLPGQRILVGHRGFLVVALLAAVGSGVGAPPAVPKAVALKGCDNHCVINGQSASCRDRIRYSMLHNFQGKEHACVASHGLVMDECKDECAGCTLQAMGCKEKNAKTPECETSCVIKGQAATCNTHIQLAAKSGHWVAGNKCAQAHNNVVKQCASCSSCSVADMSCMEPTTTTPEPSTTRSMGCVTTCSAGGYAAPCGARVQLAAIANFHSTPISCTLAYGQVLAECPMCIVCPIVDTGCVPEATSTITSSTSTITTTTNTSSTATTTTAVTETVTVTGSTTRRGLHLIGDMSAPSGRPSAERSETPAWLDKKRDKRKLQLKHHGQPAVRGGVVGWYFFRLRDFWKPGALGFVGCIFLLGLVRVWFARYREARQALPAHVPLPQSEPESRRASVAPAME